METELQMEKKSALSDSRKRVTTTLPRIKLGTGKHLAEIDYEKAFEKHVINETIPD